MPRAGRRPPRGDRRQPPARQAQAELHPARRLRRPRRRVNVDKVAFTGNKRDEKTYYKHTGYAGGIKEVTADKVLDGRFPERVLEKAVERMIPRGPLGRQQMRALHLYAGTEHPHAAPSPAARRRFAQPQEQGSQVNGPETKSKPKRPS
jgi:hypothetical protein